MALPAPVTNTVCVLYVLLLTNCLLVNILAYCWLLEFEKNTYLFLTPCIFYAFRKMEERKEEIRKEILRQILPPGVDESQLQSAEDQFGPPIDNLNLPQVCSTIIIIMGAIHDTILKSYVEP